MAFSLWYVIVIGKLNSIFEILEAIFVIVFIPSAACMPLTLMTKLLDLLSRQMLTAVQASLDTFSLITGGTGGDLKTEEHFILSLNNFECRARSVS
ncbi:hypothetical protein Pmani_024471 [Petrolisthes manimaculis]|uniref:Uncharacterized protein n=1 Tax=Petrolisthes manimaculis TaxID=1843537 RepID=A0AAE1U011_9EUCA|nr:hypothetical protein Pmani_024471 [Petrolisthes manimaculis]